MQLRIFLVLSVVFHLGLVAPAAGQEEIKSFGRRIVGGEPTTITQHPWQVALNVTINGQTYLCGGSIIADRWVLTAAHCFEPTTKPGEVRAKADATNYQTQGAWLDVEMVVVHEAYDPVTKEHDIALVRLRTRAQGRIIPLAGASTLIPVGQPLEVTGWGRTSERGKTATELLKASVPYVDNDTCNGRDAYNGAITASMMCAGHREGGVDACQGDSGGPLVWRTADGPVLVGVVSWGIGCARQLKYGVYARAANYADWVGKVVAGRD